MSRKYILDFRQIRNKRGKRSEQEIAFELIAAVATLDRSMSGAKGRMYIYRTNIKQAREVNCSIDFQTADSRRRSTDKRRELLPIANLKFQFSVRY